MICIEHAKAAFNKFIQQFDVNDPKISLKIRHTYCVMDACEYLAKEMGLAIYEVHLIDIDHDAGDYAHDGGDYIKLLDWLEETGRNYPIRIHSMNPVGVENMRRIIERNNWREIR